MLVVDVGGTNVKILATGQDEPRKFPSGPTLTPEEMVAGVKKLAGDWKYDAVSIGYPGKVVRNRLIAEPHNLGRGWMGFDFEAAFKRPVKIVNDAAMQALGSYKRGKMLFLGLGTGLGSAMIVDGIIESMELAHLPYKKGAYEDYVGERSLEKRGKKKWRGHVADVVGRLIAALEPDDVVLDGGNVRKLKELPKGCRMGDNSNAFRGGFRLWEKISPFAKGETKRGSWIPVLACIGPLGRNDVGIVPTNLRDKLVRIAMHTNCSKELIVVKCNRGIWSTVVIVVVSLVLAGCGKSEQPQARPPEVVVARVEQKDVPIHNEWVGTLEGLVNAQIRPQVTGYLLRQTYKEGAFVRKGELLFEIDPRTFQAALDQAKAQLANAEQQLALAEANQVKAQLDVDRYIPLAKEQAVTQQALDNAVQSNLAAQAQVRAAKAQIDAARAQVDAAQLNLGFTKIVSLIDGIAGIAQAQIGDLVGQTTLLTTVSTLDPIKVFFPVSERGYLNYIRENPDAAKRAAQERELSLELLLADGRVYPHKGTFSLADRQVDVKTGTLRLEGLFPNPGNILRPGQFARVRAVTTTKKGALLIPQRAVTELQGSYQVAVVGNDNKVSIRPVKVGERVGTEWIIDEGVKPGERVVAEGTQRAKAGMTVDPKPFKAMAEDKPAPTAKSEPR